MRTVWVFGDQLNRRIGALADADPSRDRILLVESQAMIEGRPYHRQRLHFVIAAMRRFALELEEHGFEVDLRRAPSLSAGLEGHLTDHKPDEVVATEPNSPKILRLVENAGVTTVPSNQFLCHRSAFAEWAGDRDNLRLEDFYRWQRRRLGYLMDGDEPAGGRWNFDHDNREPPPADGGDWPRPPQSRLDDLDRSVLAELPDDLPGADPVGWWATSRRAALARLDHFVKQVLPGFGPHEDAML
ncbi:MAG: cryptochrome/photolyase family protein, partial [Acidimicrobiia bacterium]|nr:cryptochrome/photolyase family protein [Acidimicrobiia bacterium]